MITWKLALKTCTELPSPITGKVLQEVLNCRQQRASKLLRLLHAWDYLRYTNPKKRGYEGYEVTDAGRRLVKQWEEAGVNLTKGPALYEKCAFCTKEDWERRRRDGK